MTFSLDSLDLGSLAPPRKTFKPRSKPEKVISTDWKWMLDEAEKSGGPGVSKRLKAWDDRRTSELSRFDPKLWPRLRNGMRSFSHRHLYSVTVAEIADAMARSEPPFGGTRKADRDAGRISDLTTPSPLNLMLHMLMEAMSAVPTWQDFEAHIKSQPDILLEWIAFQTKLPLELYMGEWLTHPVTRALRYRLAAAFNSFIRELHFMAVMRESHGVYLAHHFLLDAVWKIDFLYGSVAVELFVRNDDLKADSHTGRKVKCYEANPARDVIVIGIDVRQDKSTYNMPWLVTNESAASTARRLINGDHDHFGHREFYDR